MRDWIIGIVLVGGLYVALLFWHAFKWLARVAFRSIAQSFLPVESRILALLQDRATARALGMDVGIIRARRKIDFPSH
jgi:hypothetical protein